jgi:hypothetical protein
MEKFLRRFASQVIGVLCGWDRIRFQGSRGWLAAVRGFKHYLDLANVLLKDFVEHARETTNRLRHGIEQSVAQQGREIHYLSSSKRTRMGKFASLLPSTE